MFFEKIIAIQIDIGCKRIQEQIPHLSDDSKFEASENAVVFLLVLFDNFFDCNFEGLGHRKDRFSESLSSKTIFLPLWNLMKARLMTSDLLTSDMLKTMYSQNSIKQAFNGRIFEDIGRLFRASSLFQSEVSVVSWREQDFFARWHDLGQRSDQRWTARASIINFRRQFLNNQKCDVKI